MRSRPRVEFDRFGREVLDDTPVEMPVNLSRPPTIEEMVRQSIRREMSLAAQEEGYESFEEADDFVVDDEDDFVSFSEMSEMQEELPVPRSDVKGKDNGTGKDGGVTVSKSDASGNSGEGSDSLRGGDGKAS